MSLHRVIIEVGTGNDLYGQDYTKAACRAVEDALHHSSITLFRHLDISPDEMRIKVTIGVQKPEEVDRARVTNVLPHGQASVQVKLGGLNVADEADGTVHIVATAAVEAHIPQTALSRWKSVG